MTGFDQEYFDEKFEDSKWGFFESQYEQKKYDRTLRRAVERQPDPDSILELATGPGAFIEKVLQQYPEAEFTGVDISEVAVEHAEEVVEESPNSRRAEVLQDDMVNFARENDEVYDLVFMSESVYYPAENETREGFRNFAHDLGDMVADGGNLVSANIHREVEDGEYKKNDKVRMDEILRELETGGLELVENAFFPDESKTYGDKGYREHDYAIWVFSPEGGQLQNSQV